jgi:hypothetical protein
MLHLKRYTLTYKCTQGVLLWNKYPLCNTLELPWIENRRYNSCIPEGVYRITKYSGTNFHDSFWLHDVPNRHAIMIHVGNTIHDTQGCILPGLEITPRGVLQSKNAMKVLNDQLPFETKIRIQNV